MPTELLKNEPPGQEFWKRIKSIPVLPPGKERRLFQRLEENPDDESTRDKIIESNLRLVAFWARKMQATHPANGLNLEDLFQEGSIGLMHAINKFDWKKGYKFSSYATWWIRQAIRKAIGNSNFIRIPLEYQTELRKFLMVRDQLFQELEREPSTEEIAGKMGLSQKRVHRLQAILLMGLPLSLDAPVNDYNNPSLNIIPLPDNNGGSSADDNLRRDAIYQALKVLGNSPVGRRQQEILISRFGLKDGVNRTLKEMSKDFGLSREGVRQIEQQALARIRRSPKAKKLLKDLL